MGGGGWSFGGFFFLTKRWVGRGERKRERGGGDRERKKVRQTDSACVWVRQTD